MNHSKLIITNICFLIILISCGERVEIKPKMQNENHNIHTIYSVNYGTDPNAEKWFEYDENGDITKQSISLDTVVFDYSKNKIIKRHLNKNLNWNAKTEYITNAEGRIISSVLFDDKDEEISQFEFSYDEQGYLIKTSQQILSTGAHYKNEFIYESGNLKNVLIQNAQGENIAQYTFEYYEDQPNDLNLCLHQISDDIFPNNRLGIKNKNMISQLSNISNFGDTLSLLKFKYETSNSEILKTFQSDIMNDFNTEIIYHFNKK